MTPVVRYNEIKPHGALDLVSLGEVMLRLDPNDYTIEKAPVFRVFQGGGETNVACGLSYTFNLRTGVVTALVDDPVGRNIRNQLKAAGVNTDNIRWWNTKNDGGKYSTDGKGTLHNGINFTDAGRSVRPSETTYYRANTPATKMRPEDVDWDKLFGKEGVRVFNTGGIFTLIGPETADLAIEGAQKAAEYGTLVAADLNYRSKVQPDRKIARAINMRIAPHLGILFGNDSDAVDALGEEYKTKIGKNAPFGEWAGAYTETMRRIAKDFPNLSLIGTQWRGAHGADTISWGGILYDAITDTAYVAPLRENVTILDRTGGGDSFASGVLAKILKGRGPDQKEPLLQEAVDWGAAHGILVQGTPGDITMISQGVLEAEVKRAKGGGGVKAVR
ncbi:sugar kinase [Candidatus Micrarchaeota archaeon]|nr:sugar kinase [Candidatus Micrarchaeota archaeon]